MTPEQDDEKIASSIQDRIWVTAKCRVMAENRYKRYSVASHLLLSYYAILLVVSSTIPNILSPELEIFVSIVTFAASLIIYGFKFDQTGSLHRDCYLRLDDLRGQNLDDGLTFERYQTLLAGFPNHADRDYEDLIIDRTLLKSKTMWDESGPVTWNGYMLFRKTIRFLFFWITILSLACIPAYVVISKFWMPM